jgi:hypothetical protein
VAIAAKLGCRRHRAPRQPPSRKSGSLRDRFHKLSRRQRGLTAYKVKMRPLLAGLSSDVKQVDLGAGVRGIACGSLPATKVQLDCDKLKAEGLRPAK